MQGWKVCPNNTTNYVILVEPPDADPHTCTHRRCGVYGGVRGGG